MKILFTSFFVFACTLASLAQERNFLIVGKVIDGSTQQPLSGASVLGLNTTYGTTSNADGIFSIRLPNGGYDLIVSYTGYDKKSVRVSNSQPAADTLIIILSQVDKTLAEVAIVATNEVADGWQKYGKFFFDNFIGTTPNASQCSILNPEVLRFFYTKNKKRHRLKVIASGDVMVENQALGYLIRFQLDSFSYDYNSNISQYTGYPFFKEKDTAAEIKEQWIKNRARTYLGSRLHFMISLYDSVVTEDGFMVEKLAGTKNTSGTVIEDLYDSSLYVADSNEVSVNWNGRYRVSYKNVPPQKKFLEEFKLPANTKMQVTILDITDGFEIAENGYFYEQSDVVNTGYWAWKKLAEQLPYDYEYE